MERGGGGGGRQQNSLQDKRTAGSNASRDRIHRLRQGGGGRQQNLLKDRKIAGLNASRDRVPRPRQGGGGRQQNSLKKKKTMGSTASKTWSLTWRRGGGGGRQQNSLKKKRRFLVTLNFHRSFTMFIDRFNFFFFFSKRTLLFKTNSGTLPKQTSTPLANKMKIHSLRSSPYRTDYRYRWQLLDCPKTTSTSVAIRDN